MFFFLKNRYDILQPSLLNVTTFEEKNNNGASIKNSRINIGILSPSSADSPVQISSTVISITMVICKKSLIFITSC